MTTSLLYSDNVHVERLNEMLDRVTEKRFLNSQIAITAIRMCLQIYGITLPLLECEGQSGQTSQDGQEIQKNIGTLTKPPALEQTGEFIFKIVDADGREDGDSDDDLYIYIVLDTDKDDPELADLIECYAQVLDKDDLDAISDTDVLADKDFDPPVGDRAGETEWLIGTFKGDGG